MTAPLNNFFKKLNFIPVVTCLVVGLGVCLNPVEAQAGTTKITIRGPKNNAIVTNNAVVVSGTAKSKTTLAGVFVNLNNTGWTNASTGNGWSNWWANVAAAPGNNLVLAYAVDTGGLHSSTNKIKFNYKSFPGSLSGQTMVISTGGDADLMLSFTNSSFSSEDTNLLAGVGAYAFSRINNTSGKLIARYTAPPGEMNVTDILQFASGTTGFFTNADHSVSTFVLSPATNLTLASLGGALLSLTSTNDNTNRVLSFIPDPLVLSNSISFKLSNPLVIPISDAYAGNIGDRVGVLFDHFLPTSIVTNAFAGTIIAATVPNTSTNAVTNTVTVLFDKPSFANPNNSFALLGGGQISVLTYYYTNFVSDMLDSTGTGVFNYAIYSPVGALLQLAQSNESSTYVLTFDSTNSSGNYYEEFTPAVGVAGSDSGSFELLSAPQITAQPQTVNTTNTATATFNVTASGTEPLAYQWQMNSTNLADGATLSGSVISGSLTPNLSIANVSTNDVGTYFVIVANSFGSVTSSVVNLFVH